MFEAVQAIKVMPYDLEAFALALADNTQRAWSISRPQITGKATTDDVFAVLCIDAPIAEFAHVQLSITAPILVREVFATARNHIMWAQTSRNMPLIKGKFFDKGMNLTTKQLVMNAFNEMEQLRAIGTDQDFFRLKLPLSYMTTFSVSLSWRDLVRMAHTFRSLAGETCDPCIVEMFNQVRTQLEALVRTTIELIVSHDPLVPLYDDTFINTRVQRVFNSIKEQPVLLESAALGAHESKNSLVTITKWMPWALRAQLVRHRYILVQDGFRSALRNKHTLSGHMLSNTLMVSATAPKEVWRTLIKERSCWIAQADLWYDLLNAASEYVVDGQTDFVKLLPCAGGVCPFDADARQRLLGKDPGPPCPRHMQLNAPTCFSLNQETEDAMDRNLIYMSKPAQAFWETTIQGLRK